MHSRHTRAADAASRKGAVGPQLRTHGTMVPCSTCHADASDLLLWVGAPDANSYGPSARARGGVSTSLHSFVPCLTSHLRNEAHIWLHDVLDHPVSAKLEGNASLSLSLACATPLPPLLRGATLAPHSESCPSPALGKSGSHAAQALACSVEISLEVCALTSEG